MSIWTPEEQKIMDKRKNKKEKRKRIDRNATILRTRFIKKYKLQNQGMRNNFVMYENLEGTEFKFNDKVIRTYKCGFAEDFYINKYFFYYDVKRDKRIEVYLNSPNIKIEFLR